MRNSLIVMARELGERRLLWWLGVIGLLPLALPLLGDAILADPNFQTNAAMTLAAVATATLAILLGSTVIGSDLAERRLGFYFARPISGLSLWAGKTGAAAVLALGIGVLILLPAAVIHGLPAPFLTSLQAWVTWLCAALLLLGASHAVGIMVRARDAWLALDLGVFVGAGLTLWLLARQLWQKGGDEALQLPLSFLLVGVWGIIPTLGALQVIRGRSDLRRGHRILSRFAAALLLPLAAAFAAYTHWFLHPGLRDLSGILAASGSPDGRWIAFAGTAPYRGTLSFGFLADFQGRRTLPIDLTPVWDGSGRGNVHFSADGRRAAWLAPQRPGGSYELMTLELGRQGAEPGARAVSFAALPQSIALSPDGSRIAAAGAGRLTVSAVDDGRLLASVALEEGYLSVVRFTNAQTLRVFRQEGDAVVTSDVDLPSGRIHPFGKSILAFPPWEVSADGRWLLARDLVHHHEIRQLFDLSTGQPRGDLNPPGAHGRAAFLLDGRIAVAAKPRAAEAELWLYSPEGAALSPTPFFHARQAKGIWLAAQSDPHHLLIAVSPPRESQSFRTVLLDLEQRTSREVATKDTWPMLLLGKLPAAGLFLSSDGMVVVDPTTGERRRLPA